MWSWSQTKYHFGVFLSVPSLVDIWFLLNCNKLSEWSGVFMGQLVLSELEINGQKSWRTRARTDKSSTLRHFELMSVQTNVLTPLVKNLVNYNFMALKHKPICHKCMDKSMVSHTGSMLMEQNGYNLNQILLILFKPSGWKLFSRNRHGLEF